MPKPSKLPLLLQLPSREQDALFTWLTEEKVTYAEARRRLSDQFGVKSGNGALSVFWSRVCEPRLWAAQRKRVSEIPAERLLLNISVSLGLNNNVEIRLTGPLAKAVTAGDETS